MVDQEVLDTDAEHFDCETCPLATRQATLDRDNAEAWGIYGQLRARFTADTGLVPEVFRRLVEGWPTHDVLDLTERLGVIYDVLQPPTPRSDD